MIVYVLMQGETHEGGSTLGVFSTADKAKEYAEARDHYCPWNPWESHSWGGRATMTRNDAGCEWQSIEEWEVTE